jgi:hypothetical protein
MKQRAQELKAAGRRSSRADKFQPAQKFKTRYATLAFSDAANRGEGTMWPTSYALPELTAASEARIGALVRQAAS